MPDLAKVPRLFTKPALVMLDTSVADVEHLILHVRDDADVEVLFGLESSGEA
jgi:hypothetical protein